MTGVADGSVEAIYLVPQPGARPEPVEQVLAVAGDGLVGDHHRGDNRHDPKRQLTLIAAEALAAAAAAGTDLRDGSHRRNVVVRGVPLNDLVGAVFTVGAVRVRGVKLCEPCAHMERLSGQPGAVRALVHRGGLNAEILDGGELRIGDPVAAATSDADSA